MEKVAPKIVLNAVRCDGCKRVLVSSHRHDFRQCECGTFVDGGYDYIRRGIPPNGTFTDLTIMLVDGVLKLATDMEN